MNLQFLKAKGACKEVDGLTQKEIDMLICAYNEHTVWNEMFFKVNEIIADRVVAQKEKILAALPKKETIMAIIEDNAKEWDTLNLDPVDTSTEIIAAVKAAIEEAGK